MNKIKEKVKKFILLFKEEKVKPIFIYKSEENLLKDKKVIITGGNSGIGYSIAKKCLQSGADVVIIGSNQKKLDNSVEDLKEYGNVLGVKLDIQCIDQFDIAIEKSLFFLKGRVDILVNSAGVVPKKDFWNIDDNEYQRIMDINVKGTFFMSQKIAHIMIDKNIKGHILNISSSSALRPAWTPYEMSKWAIKGFTKGLADTLIDYGIIVNAIAPGPTATPMLNKKISDGIYLQTNPSKRYALAEEIASLAIYMMSGAGNMIVGDTVYITGGSGTISLHN